MKRPQRLAIALVVLLMGLALTPYVALPFDRFGWQQIGGIYSPENTYRIYIPLVVKS